MLDPHLEILNWQQTPKPEAQFPIDAPPFEVHSSDVKHVPISEGCFFRDPWHRLFSKLTTLKREKNPGKIISNCENSNETFLNLLCCLLESSILVQFPKTKQRRKKMKVFTLDHMMQKWGGKPAVSPVLPNFQLFCRPAMQFLGRVWLNKDLDRLRSLLRLEDFTTG